MSGAVRRVSPPEAPPQRGAGRQAKLSAGGGVVALSFAGIGLVAVLDQQWTGRLSLFFDLCFVLGCVIAALLVRRSGLFTVAVLPPLLMLVVLSIFTIADPATLTAEHLAFASTLLTGLAHHAAALVAGHGSALVILVARGTIGPEAG